MRAVFIAGTDTGVGKTFVTKRLYAYLKSKGRAVAIQKWIETGLGKAGGRCDLKRPYVFKTACSPHLSSRLERRCIDKNKIKKSFRELSRCFDFVIVEGIGGVLVPFNESEFVIDIVRELRLPVILVAENKLGAINHTLMSLEALDKRRIKMIGVIFNNRKKGDARVLKDNPRIVKALSGCNVLGVLRRDFNAIGRRIFNELT